MSMTTAPASPLVAGTVLAGRYRIARTLGVGAWGRVYLATDTADPAAPQVAIKEMQDAHLGTDEERTVTAPSSRTRRCANMSIPWSRRTPPRPRR